MVHLHGVFAPSWVLLFVAQPLFVRYAALRTHKRFGRVALPLAVGVAVSMLPAGVFQATRGAAAGSGPTGISGLLGVLALAILFAALVAAGIVARRDRDSRARWLLLATLVAIRPTLFRFRHWLPDATSPDIWFGVVLSYGWIVVAMLRDKLSRGAVHPGLLFGGGAVILEQSLEVVALDTLPWRVTAQLLYDWLQGML